MLRWPHVHTLKRFRIRRTLLFNLNLSSIEPQVNNQESALHQISLKSIMTLQMIILPSFPSLTLKVPYLIQSFKMTCWHPAFTRSVFLGLILITLDFMLKSLDPETHYMQSWKGGTLVHRINLGWYDFLQLNTLRLSKSRSVGICSRPMETKSKTLIRCLGIHHKFDIYHAIVS